MMIFAGRKTPVALVLGFALMLASLALAAAGDLDPTFSDDGKLTTNFTGGADYAAGVAIQADGKIVAAGRAGASGSTGGRFGLARYDPDGTLDVTFDGDGKLATDFLANRNDEADEVAIQADGKIVAAGFAGSCCYGPDSHGRFAVARYNPDGTLDATFSGDGKVTTKFTPGNDIGLGLAIQADGKIVAAGRAGGLGGRFGLVRYNPNGTLDVTFSGDGKVTTNFTATNDFVTKLAIQTDGKIVAAGRAASGFPRTDRFALARYNANGTLDRTFSGDGKVTTKVTTGFDYANGLAIQTDGKIVAAGRAGGMGGRFGLVRYNPNGTLDSSFSGDGKAVTNFFARSDESVSDVLIQGDGKIVAVGTAAALFAVARYDPDGVLDPTFSGDGKVTTEVTSTGNFASGGAIQADGKIMAAGAAGCFFFCDATFVLVRYLVG